MARLIQIGLHVWGRTLLPLVFDPDFGFALALTLDFWNPESPPNRAIIFGRGIGTFFANQHSTPNQRLKRKCSR
jgi:hypothetical protein